MSSWAVAVTAAPRPVDYLPATLASVRAAGWPAPTVIAEPGTPIPPGVPRIVADVRRGPWLAFQAAVTTLLTAGPQGANLAILQDDILLARGLRGWLDRQEPPPDAGILSLYLSESQAEGRPAGWSRLPVDRVPYGACSIILSAEVARRLVDEPPHRGNGRMTDTWLGVFCEREGLGFYQHNPSLCRHVGRESSLARKGHRPITRPWIPARHEGEFCGDVALLGRAELPV